MNALHMQRLARRAGSKASTCHASDLEGKLVAGQKALSRARWIITGTLLTIGISCLLCDTLILIRNDVLKFAIEEQSIFGHLVYLCAAGADTLFQTMILLAPLADDILTVQRLNVMLLVFSSLWCFGITKRAAFGVQRNLSELSDHDCMVWDKTWPKEDCWFVAVATSMHAAAYAWNAISCAMATRLKSPARILSHMRRGICIVNLVTLVMFGGLSLYILFASHALVRIWWNVITSLPTLYVVLRPQVGHRLHAWISKYFFKRRATAASAGIAGLMSDCTVREALQNGTSRFRSVSLSQLTYQNCLDSPTCAQLDGGGPLLNLVSLSKPCKLGECDAFMSHSWHDDADLKWEAIQQWRAAFIMEHGREPRIWFDKCCIDQTDIVEDLRGLPIFLSGCKQMLVLCGPSYLSRLWCVVELFTYVHMGGQPDELEVKLLAREGDGREEDLRSIMASIENFDAEQCECFTAADKERMLAIIRTAFGSTMSFNAAVRAIFSDSGMIQDVESAAASSNIPVASVSSVTRVDSAACVETV